MISLMMFACLVQAPQTLDVTTVGKDPRWHVAGRTTAVVDTNGKHALRMIDVQHGYGGSADGGKTDQHGPQPLKMMLPALATGIEQPDDFACERVATAKVRSLSQVTEGAIALPLILTGLDPPRHIR